MYLQFTYFSHIFTYCLHTLYILFAYILILLTYILLTVRIYPHTTNIHITYYSHISTYYLLQFLVASSLRKSLQAHGYGDTLSDLEDSLDEGRDRNRGTKGYL